METRPGGGGGSSELRHDLCLVSEAVGLPRQQLEWGQSVSLERGGEVSPVPSAREQQVPFPNLELPIGSEATTVSHGRSSEASSESSPPMLSREDLCLHSPPDQGFLASPIPSPKTPVFSPLPYTPLGGAEVQCMIKRSRKAASSAKQLFP